MQSNTEQKLAFHGSYKNIQNEEFLFIFLNFVIWNQCGKKLIKILHPQIIV